MRAGLIRLWRRSRRLLGAVGVVGGALAILVGLPWTGAWVPVAGAVGVGGASWTPSRSSSTLGDTEHLVPSDSLIVETTATWSRSQRRGLAHYVEEGLRYTIEVNDRSGRLNATGYWATNLPDPAFDRDDDDGDRRWEEAEITAGAELPRPNQAYVSLVSFSRWHPKRARRCDWAWDRRKGSTEVFSQLSRDLFGEWQAERYTLTYDRVAYPRAAPRPALPDDVVPADCGAPAFADPGEQAVVATFARPLTWAELLALDSDGGGWSGFEAIGSSARDDLVWTCGGPVGERAGVEACEGLGVRAEGVVAAGGSFAPEALAALEADPLVILVQPRQDAFTALLGGLGGFGVEPPDLTLNDAYWRLVLGR